MLDQQDIPRHSENAAHQAAAKEKAEARRSATACSLSRYCKMPDDGCGEWIGTPNNGGDVGDMLDIVGELNGLLIALHDAINRPKGVVPESAERFYQANEKSPSVDAKE